MRSEDTCEITSHEPVVSANYTVQRGQSFQSGIASAEEGGAVQEKLPASSQHLLGSGFRTVVTLRDREKSTFSHNRVP